MEFEVISNTLQEDHPILIKSSNIFKIKNQVPCPLSNLGLPEVNQRR